MTLGAFARSRVCIGTTTRFGPIRVAEDVMASLDPVKPPAAAFERPDCLPRRDRWQARYAPTLTRSSSTGLGRGSPCSSSDSR